MGKSDYYEVLGVNRDADPAAIKTAYRRLAMKYHPDRNANDSTAEAKFKEVQEAYSCLSDDKKRAAYDRFGHDAFQQAGAGGAAHGEDFSNIFDNVFSDFFGGREGASRRQRVLDITLQFEEMVNGCEKTIRLTLPQDCTTCSGSGAAKNGKTQTCKTCGGAGRVQSQRGFFAFQQTCSTCRGKGKTIDKPCKICSGNGKVMKERNLSVKLPAGIEDGTLVRINVDGGGDEILLRPSVIPHPLFQRNGDDLHIEIPIAITTAVLGGEVNVPSVTGGKIRVKIPEGIQSGQLLRVPGEGVPSIRRRQQRGSILCHIVVETPVNLSAKQKALLQEFDNSLKNKHSPKGNSWLDKVKDLFSD